MCNSYKTSWLFPERTVLWFLGIHGKSRTKFEMVCTQFLCTQGTEQWMVFFSQLLLYSPQISGAYMTAVLVNWL